MKSEILAGNRCRFDCPIRGYIGLGSRHPSGKPLCPKSVEIRRLYREYIRIGTVKRLLPLTAGVLLLLLGVIPGLAATRTTTASGGAWSATTTWSGGVVPNSPDAVIILAGASIT